MRGLIRINFMTYLCTGFIYPYGNDWEKFILLSIQHWEAFYIQWIRKEKNIFIIYPDSLVEDLAKTTLKDLATFRSLKWIDPRLNRLSKPIKELHPRSKDNLKTPHLDKKPKKFLASMTNSCVPSHIYTFDIYSKTHRIWINSSIRNVKHELEKRGLDLSYIFDGEKNYFRICICPDS